MSNLFEKGPEEPRGEPREEQGREPPTSEDIREGFAEPKKRPEAMFEVAQSLRTVRDAKESQEICGFLEERWQKAKSEEERAAILVGFSQLGTQENQIEKRTLNNLENLFADLSDNEQMIAVEGIKNKLLGTAIDLEQKGDKLALSEKEFRESVLGLFELYKKAKSDSVKCELLRNVSVHFGKEEFAMKGEVTDGVWQIFESEKRDSKPNNVAFGELVYLMPAGEQRDAFLRDELNRRIDLHLRKGDWEDYEKHGMILQIIPRFPREVQRPQLEKFLNDKDKLSRTFAQTSLKDLDKSEKGEK